MTGLFTLDWAILSISLFNTIVLFWLALTVLLNSDHHNIGVWMMSGGLILGGTFFVSHIAILGQSLNLNLDGLNSWWQYGWIPVTLAPLAWYSVILWFYGFWESNRSAIHRRHRWWLVCAIAIGAILIFALVVLKPIPDFANFIQLNLSASPTIYGIPILLIGIPAYMVVCIGLSLDVLIRPDAASSLTIQMGRQRARFWLIATASSLLLVSVLVTYIVIRVVIESQVGSLFNIQSETIGIFDLLLSILIATAIVLLGQAIMAYEVFTGRVLPRRELNRQWRTVIFGALGISAITGWSLVEALRPIYILLLLTGLMTSFYALYSWRTLIEHDGFVRRLRPFASNQKLVSQLINPNDDQDSHAAKLFQITCSEILNTSTAQLVPLGPLAPMVGKPLCFPIGNSVITLKLPDHLDRVAVAIAAEDYQGFDWVIPLWAERGLSGALYIAHKQDRGFYTQEEIDLAQASGERIIDLLAAEQMTKRLMQIQRKRSAENSIIDLRARRKLHDDVLPGLHEVILRLSSQISHEPALKENITLLAKVHQEIAELIRLPLPMMNTVGSDNELVSALKTLIDTEFSKSFDQINWKLTTDSIPLTDPLVKEVLLGAARELVRNAAVHGRRNQNQELGLTITVERSTNLSICIADNGVGLEAETEKSQVSSGSGLGLHRALLAVIGGTCIIEQVNPHGTRSTIIVPCQMLVEALQ
jgi:signal transduction histidine kinase